MRPTGIRGHVCDSERSVAPPRGNKSTRLYFYSNSQRHGAGLQVEGLGVPELHLQTLRGSDPARHHPHLHEGREGLTHLNRETLFFLNYGHRVGPPLAGGLSA